MILIGTLLFVSGYTIGYCFAMQEAIRRLREQNNLLIQQNNLLSSQRQQPQDDQANYWKPKDWEPGDA